MKLNLKGLGLILIGLTLSQIGHAKQLNVGSDAGKQKLISAVGDGDMGRALGESICSFKDTVLTAAQIDTLNATPISLVPAPGVGKVNVICEVDAWLNYGGTAWAGSSETIPIKYGTAGVTATTITEAFMESTTDKYIQLAPVDGIAPVENAALYATANADFTTGNSPLSVRVYYRTLGGSLILSN